IVLLLPFEQSLSASHVGEMFQFIAPNCLHGSCPIPVAIGNIWPLLAALLVLFHLFVARCAWKRTAPHPFSSVLRCVRCPGYQELRRRCRLAVAFSWSGDLVPPSPPAEKANAR